MKWFYPLLFLWTCFLSVYCHTEFETNLTPEKVIIMIVSHLVIIPGIYLFWRMKKYDFMLVGILCFLQSMFYHACQEGWFDRVSLEIPHIGDFTVICVGTIVIFLSIFEVDMQIRLCVVLIFYTFPFMLAALTYDSYAMIATLAVAFFVILFFQHQYNMRNYKKYRIDKFNIVCFLFLVVFAGGGTFFIYWGGNPGYIHYWWRHMIWHGFAFGDYDILAMIYFHSYLTAIEEGTEKQNRIIYVDENGKEVHIVSKESSKKEKKSKKQKKEKKEKKEKKSKHEVSKDPESGITNVTTAGNSFFNFLKLERRVISNVVNNESSVNETSSQSYDSEEETDDLRKEN